MRTPAPGVMKFTILLDHNYIFSLYYLCSGVEKNIFEGIMYFYSMTNITMP